MTTTYHTAIATGAPANASTINTPLGALDAVIGTQGGGANATTNYLISHWYAATLRLSAPPTYDSDGVVTAASVIWPDGSAGAYSLTTKDSVWLEATEWTLTHADSSQTLTGSGLVRDSDGEITTEMSFAVS